MEQDKASRGRENEAFRGQGYKVSRTGGWRVTKKGFREAMMRGLGRCVLELESTEDTEWYREVVLWGCTHDLSYDTQCLSGW